MALDRWAKLREVERYQLNIAEKYFRESQWKVAGDEYEKFLKLYERSIGAPYAQLKWSMCQIKLRNLNTAIKDGFQSVIDYYPESPEAVSSALLIGRTYKDMGDLSPAKKAYDKLLKTHPKHYIAVLARMDLVEIAEKEKDDVRRSALLRELTYEVERKGAAATDCVLAARLLTQHCFRQADFLDGMKALGTTCDEPALPGQLMSHHHGHLPWVLQELAGQTDEESKKKTRKLGDDATAWMKTRASPRNSARSTTRCWRRWGRTTRFWARWPTGTGAAASAISPARPMRSSRMRSRASRGSRRAGARTASRTWPSRFTAN
jgi:tetratricopeptide (TPR) repeat protein